MSRVCARLNLPGFSDVPYWHRVRQRAAALGSDGCSGPTIPVHVDACYEHDCHYRDHITLLGDPISRADADAVLRERVQQQSPFGVLSPMAWWRWAAVRLGGYWAYHDLARGTSLVSALLVALLLAGCAAPSWTLPEIERARQRCLESGQLWLETQDAFGCRAVRAGSS